MILSKQERLDLVRLMLEKEMTRKQVSEISDVEFSSLCKFLKGKVNLRPENQIKIKEAIYNYVYVCSECGKQCRCSVDR